MRKTVTILLIVVLCIGLAPTAFAASDEAVEAADALNGLGLFNGTGTNPDGTPIYDLDRAPTRFEAVTMLVRLLGKEAEAKAGTWETPFTDVVDWAKPYVGYAYANGLTNGTGATTFGGTAEVTASQYLTFVLRALGYDSSTDFKWDAAWELSDEIGLTDGRYNAETKEFLRGDVTIISNSALSVKTKAGDKTLFDVINEQGFGKAEWLYGDYFFSGDLVEINGNIYDLDGVTFTCGMYSALGGDGVYMAGYGYVELAYAICLGTRSYRMVANTSPYLAGTIVNSQTPSGYYSVTYGTYRITAHTEYISLTESYNCYDHIYNGKNLECSDILSDGYDEDACFYYGDIRCIAADNTLYNVQDVYDYFGILYNVTLEERLDGDTPYYILVLKSK